MSSSMSKLNHSSYISLFPVNAAENRTGTGHQDQHVNETVGRQVRPKEQECIKNTKAIRKP